MKKFAAVLIAATFHTVSSAGPLGLEMGTSLKDLQAMVELKGAGPHIYSTPVLPDGHPDFNKYLLVVTPQHGLCKLIAKTHPLRTSVYGTDLLSAFDRYYAVIATKYGAAKRLDGLRPGSIWREGRDWMMGLLKKERVLSAYWFDEDLKLPDNLAAITLEASAAGTESGEIHISYEFKNASDCIDWVEVQRDSKL